MKTGRIKSLHVLANVAYTLPVSKRRALETGEVVKMLKKQQGERSLRQFASDLGISAPYLSDIYHGRRRPGKAVLSQLGLVKKEPVRPEPTYEVA
jgi:DNA-binding transcriptional regulator YiaG